MKLLTSYGRYFAGSLFAFALVVTATFTTVRTAEAGLLRRVAQSARQEPASPSDQVQAPPAADLSGTASPSCLSGTASSRCIRYRHHCTLRKTCCSCGTIETTLQVKDPCECCVIPICICLPDCCTDCPKVCAGRGLLGRSTVTYEWCCGYKVRVVFDRCGDITVHSYGR